MIYKSMSYLISNKSDNILRAAKFNLIISNLSCDQMVLREKRMIELDQL